MVYLIQRVISLCTSAFGFILSLCKKKTTYAKHFFIVYTNTHTHIIYIYMILWFLIFNKVKLYLWWIELLIFYLITPSVYWIYGSYSGNLPIRKVLSSPEGVKSYRHIVPIPFENLSLAGLKSDKHTTGQNTAMVLCPPTSLERFQTIRF